MECVHEFGQTFRCIDHRWGVRLCAKCEAREKVDCSDLLEEDDSQRCLMEEREWKETMEQLIKATIPGPTLGRMPDGSVATWEGINAALTAHVAKMPESMRWSA